MKRVRVTKHRDFFKVLVSTRSTQAAAMTLRPGQSTGEPQNEHPRSEQWLFVISGTGRARVGRRSIALKPGDLLVIQKDEVHQIKNTGRQSLVTLNLYTPPAYDSDGELK